MAPQQEAPLTAPPLHPAAPTPLRENVQHNVRRIVDYQHPFASVGLHPEEPGLVLLTCRPGVMVPEGKEGKQSKQQGIVREEVVACPAPPVGRLV